MKKIFTLLFGIVFSITVLNAQEAPPQAFSYKATVKKANGALVTSKTISLRISILQNSIDGIAVYTETFNPTTNQLGQIDIEIGHGTVVTGNFSSIEWSSDEYFLKVEVDIKGGSKYQLLSVTQLLSVPYALYSGEAGNGFASVYTASEKRPILGEDGSVNIGTAPDWWNKLKVNGFLTVLPGPNSYWGSTISLDSRSQPGGLLYLISSLSDGSGEGPGKFLIRDDEGKSTFLMDKDGKVGLGNYNPAFKLDVSGDINFTGGLYKNGNPFSLVSSWSEITNKPTFATVATSGSYNDLTDKPGGNNIGDMQYWDGTAWVMVPIGQPGQFLQVTTSNIPAWSGAAFPTVTTTAVSSIRSDSATTGGNVTSDGGAAITARGVCWSTSSNPTTANRITIDSTGTGIFTSLITELELNTTYYVRAYATNSAGTAYGNEISFTTNPGGPVVTTFQASAVWTTSAVCGGKIDSLGGEVITTRGLCISTTPDPTTANRVVPTGTGTGSFSILITGLIPNSTYYVRAFATISTGIVYGNEISFTTNSPGVPVITTTPVSSVSITPTTVLCGGNVISDGGAALTARGVCFSTTPDPTTANSVVSAGTGTGNFTTSIAGLTPNTTYYFRAFATNTFGTVYGQQVYCTTLALDMTIIFNPDLTYGTLTDINDNSYKTIQIGTQVWMAENLRVTKYRDGTDIPNIAAMGTWVSLISGAYCSYNNDTAYVPTFGHLYNFYAVIDNRNLCPAGWHVPSDIEWTTLTDYLISNGYGYQGSGSDIAKSLAGASIWTTYSTAGTIGNDMASNNNTGFTALPGGIRNLTGIFYSLGTVGGWWSSSVNTSSTAWFRLLNYNFTDAGRVSNTKSGGLSVRCVKN